MTLGRGKVNALNEAAVTQLKQAFEVLETRDAAMAVMLTGRGSFFSFGFDIPELLEYSKADFHRFVSLFTGLYRYLFLYPKPVIAALNGHAVAGGCMLATACDYRIMATGKAKIGLNELTFGSTIFAGSAELLQHCVGTRTAETILLSGSLYSAEEAKALGLVDEICAADQLGDSVARKAQEFARCDLRAFGSAKLLLRRPVSGRMRQREEESIGKFVELWYSEDTRTNLERIKIHS